MFQRVSAPSVTSGIIGADFVVKYEWGSTTVVIDKREIMRTLLLQTVCKPKDDGSPDDDDDDDAAPS